MDENNDFKLGTIHDSFFSKVDTIDALKKVYKEGLIQANRVHAYNIIYWLYDICTTRDYMNKAELAPLIKKLEELIVIYEQLGDIQDLRDIRNVQYACFDELLEHLEKVAKVMPSSSTNNWHLILQYFKNGALKDAIELETILDENPGEALFSDNR